MHCATFNLIAIMVGLQVEDIESGDIIVTLRWIPFVGYLEGQGQMEPGLLDLLPRLFPSPGTILVPVPPFEHVFVVIYGRAPDHLTYLQRQKSKGAEASAKSVIKPTRFGEPLHIMVLE